MKALTLDVGLLGPSGPANLVSPNRANTGYCDGTTFTPLTDNWFDGRTGEFHGNTRSKDGLNPRWAATFYGKNAERDKNGSRGLPIALMGAHGELRWQRVVTGVSMYFDRNETGASMGLFHQAVEIYGAGLHAFAYDRLLAGKFIREVMLAGVMPLVEMKGASPHDPHVAVPEGLQYKLGNKSQPKPLAIARALETITHPVGGGRCAHQIWALDGMLRSCPPDEHRPNFDSDILQRSDLRFHEDANGSRSLVGHYEVPCRHGDVKFRFDHSGQRMGSSHECALADWVRPIHIPLEAPHLRGFRVDVESVFRTAKGAETLFGRASSLEPDFFLLDIVGFALWQNAIAWDVHASQHTVCGQHCAAAVARKANRSAQS
ncbi:hypothetical protein [Gemmatimonas sp.]|uniref:hypothetical protein n=1 Tax=Gemmatimonas sp. TaxID=1962908 RepID=UPI003566B684